MESIHPTVIPAATGSSDIRVHQFRQILIWPLQLMPLKPGLPLENHWEYLTNTPNSRWDELEDDFPADAAQYQERHYREFVAFLPHVQRFLYGERASRSGRSTYGESPIRILRRSDICAARLHFRGDPQPLEIAIVHIVLYFFFPTL